MPSTASRTTANAGIAATTAPNPTRLATLMAGSAEALTPASMVTRKSGMRRRLSRRTVAMAQERAVITDHTPLTPAAEVAPHRDSAKKPRSSRARTKSDKTRLTRMTTTIGAAAVAMGGCSGAARPWRSRRDRIRAPSSRVRAASHRRRGPRPEGARRRRSLRPFFSQRPPRARATTGQSRA